MHAVIVSSNGMTQIYPTTEVMIDNGASSDVVEMARMIDTIFNVIGTLFDLLILYVILEILWLIATWIFRKDHKPKLLLEYVYYWTSDVSKFIFSGLKRGIKWFRNNVLQPIRLYNSRGKTMKFKKNPEFDEIEAWQALKPFTLEHNGCRVDVKPGDWVGQDGFGNLRVYDTEVFAKAFVKVADTGVAVLTSGE